jgi:PAS domain S-box-containing protein
MGKELRLNVSDQMTLLYEETKKKLDELTILYEVTKISTLSLNLDQMLTEITKSLSGFFGFETLGIFLTEGNTKRLFLHPSSIGYSMGNIQTSELCLGKGIVGWVAEKGEPLLVNDVRKDPRYLGGDAHILSEMCAPLKAGEKIIGVIDAQSRQLDAFSEGDLRLFKITAEHLATIIENVQSEERYRTVVESALDGVLVMGGDYRLSYVNERLAGLLGYKREEISGIDFRDFLDEESKRMVVDWNVKRQRGEEVSSQYEINVLRKSGGTRNVEINAAAIWDPQGNMNTVAFLKDVTEKRRMEEHLLQAEKLRAVGEMASGIAHDFNNALAIILGNTQLLLFNAEDQELRETLKTIERVAQDSARTVRRLMEFTKKGIEKEFFRVDLNAVVRDAVEITKPMRKNEVQGKRVSIEFALNLERIPPVAGNASELREVVTNIIFNAMEAMPQGGRLEIRTFLRKERVYIEISDTGIGMTEEVRRKVFEPFFTTKPFTNTGLGLSMSYGIIRRFGGEIEVESELGKGTVFTISLPIAAEEKEDIAVPSPIKREREIRVLVIGDEEYVRSVLSRSLSQFNHRVTTAKDGEEGLRLFKEKEFDVVLTDLGMPNMSGWEVYKAIKEMSPNTPVGMITGWGMDVDQVNIKRKGLDFMISKPFDFNQILNVVAEALESKGKADLKVNSKTF